MSEENEGGSNRKQTIVDAIKRISALEGERKSIGEDIRSVKNKLIKGELKMKIGDFNVAMRLYNLEGEDRNELLDTIHETFNALGIGDQLDWLKASEKVQAGASVTVEGDGEGEEPEAGEDEEPEQEAAE